MTAVFWAVCFFILELPCDSSKAYGTDKLTFTYEVGGIKKPHEYMFGKEVFIQTDRKIPEKGKPFFDPVFGTRITRISDRKIDKLKPWSKTEYGSLMHPAYTRYNHGNADGSKILLFGSIGSGKALYDLNSLKIIKTLRTKAVNWNQPVEPRWDAHDPNILYYHFSPATALSMYDIKRDVFGVIHDFRKDFMDATAITMSEEGDCSNDSRYFAFLIRGVRGGDKWAHCAVVCYDRVTDRIVGRLELPIQGLENQGGGNWVGMSPSGRYVLVGTAPVLVYDREFKKSPIKMTHGGGWHCDVGLDDEGREVLFYMGGQRYSPGGQSDGCYAMCDLETGVETVLTEKIGGPEMHFDCSNILKPGWGLVSTYHGGVARQSHWTEYSIHLVELTKRKAPPPRIWRICHTHVDRESYSDDPFATFDRFGKKIFFGSNWGRPIRKGGDIDTYQVELPADWYERLMREDRAEDLTAKAEKLAEKRW